MIIITYLKNRATHSACMRKEIRDHSFKVKQQAGFYAPRSHTRKARLVGDHSWPRRMWGGATACGEVF
jgi:hypothetical protein